MESNQLPLVSIQCLVYNHEPYLRQCLDGFVMQKTNFKFEAIVHDDVSTDGSAAIIREYAEKYPDIIIPIFETENQYSKGDGSLDRIMHEASRGKYIAICEGDDYWTDPLKLQKQVDFLNENSDYILVHSDFIALNDETGEKIRNASSKYKIYEGNVFENLFEACFVRTPTICYRNINLELKTRDLPINTFGGDLFLFYNLASKGKFHFMHEETCVYRVLKESASHTPSARIRKLRWQKYKNLDYFIANYFNVNQAIISMLDYKWFKIDLRNCIATNDFETIKGLVLPGPEVSIVDKYLYYCCKSRLLTLILCVLLKIKGVLGCNKWF